MSQECVVEWRPDNQRIRHAQERVLSILQRGTAGDDLRTYYELESDYAGTTFLNLKPNDPWAVTPADLLAVSTLSVSIRPPAVRRFMDPKISEELSGLLRMLPAELAINSVVD